MAGNSSVTGLETVTYTDNMSFDGTARGGAMTTNGELWIGSTAGRHVKKGSITSPNGTITIGYSSPNITLDLAGGSIGVDSIAVQTGTSPIVPTAAGLVTINGAVVAAGTNPIRSNGTGANTLALEVQTSQALAAADATKIGLSNFDSASFSVAATGFVTASGTGLGKTITGDTGGALSPTAGNWNLLGSGSITTIGSGSTLTTQLTGLTNHAVLVGAGTTTITKLAVGATGTVLAGATAADPAFTATPAVTSITLSGGTALSSYVEGTFVAGLSFGGGSTGIVYVNNGGTYTKIGRAVFIQLTMAISNKGSSTGAAKITGLPFTVAAITGQFMVVLNGGGLTYPATYLQLAALADVSATTASLVAATSITAQANLADTNFANVTTIYMNGFYYV